MKIGWFRLREEVDWIIFHSDCKHLPVIQQFSEPK